jgi:hypothetical protein
MTGTLVRWRRLLRSTWQCARKSGAHLQLVLARNGTSSSKRLAITPSQIFFLLSYASWLTTPLVQCMSNGLKNIQSHARSYSRKQRNGQQGIASHGYDDDSAVSGIGLTPVDDLDPGADGGYSSPEAPSTSSASSGTGLGSGGRTTGASSVQHQHHQDQYDGTHSMSSSFQSYPHQAYGHGYSSSVSSSGTPAYHGGQMNGHVSQAEPSYQPAPRQSSIDMDIRAIMNRPTGANMRAL